MGVPPNHPFIDGFSLINHPAIGVPLQEPKLEVPTIYQAYIMPKFQGISSQNMANSMVLTYFYFRTLKLPLIRGLTIKIPLK
jgi:hypothetical protein